MDIADEEALIGKPRSDLPVALRAVAVLTFLQGVACVIEVILALRRGDVNINFGILFIPAAIGLYRLSQGWRTFVLFMLWIILFICPLVFFMILGNSVSPLIKIMGVPMGTVGPAPALVIVALIFIISLWEYWVLTRRDVRTLFRLAPK